MEFLHEDLLRSRQSKETGYVGMNSEIQWLRSVQRQTQQTDPDPSDQRYGPPGSSREARESRSQAFDHRRQHASSGNSSRVSNITDASFYLDGDDIELDIAVDPYEMPDPDIAQKLFECYVNTVHCSFPILPATFVDQFHRFIEAWERNRPYEVPDKWRATMNIVFAIGAKYAHLVEADWRGDDRDHLIYMTRANRLLGMRNTAMIIAGPDLELIQAVGSSHLLKKRGSRLQSLTEIRLEL